MEAERGEVLEVPGGRAELAATAMAVEWEVAMVEELAVGGRA